jgi:hypothetical protein
VVQVEVGDVGTTIIAVLDGGADDMTVDEDGVGVAEEEGGATIAVEVATATPVAVVRFSRYHQDA